MSKDGFLEPQLSSGFLVEAYVKMCNVPLRIHLYRIYFTDFEGISSNHFLSVQITYLDHSYTSRPYSVSKAKNLNIR